MSPAVQGIGVDAGSTTTKIAAVDATGALLAWAIEVADPRVDQQVTRMVEALRQAHQAHNAPVVATGYGRKRVDSDRSVTEITCHARGVFEALGQAGTLVDIGGQDSKVIVIGPKGRAVDFAMNDKCAAGTGRFLEVTAARLKVNLEDLGPRALSSPEEDTVSSTCTVFAESEIISLVAHGSSVDAILKGLHRSLVHRVAALLKSVGLTPPLMLSGGVALNPAIPIMLGEAAGAEVRVPEHPQLMGALGAALLASR